MYHVRPGLPLLSARVSNLRRRNLPSGRAESGPGKRKEVARVREAFSPILATSLSIVGATSKLTELNGVLTPLDPILTLTRTQYPAIVSITEQRNSFVYAGFAIRCNTQRPMTAHS